MARRSELTVPSMVLFDLPPVKAILYLSSAFSKVPEK